MFRKFSLKDNLDSMYKDRQSHGWQSKSDGPSELAGSVPDSHPDVAEKVWEKRYESPSDVGKVTLLKPQSSGRDLSLVSPMSQTFPDNHTEPAELPARSNTKTATMSELPGRSDVREPT